MKIENLGQLLNHLATKAGIDTKDQNLINVLSNAELSKVQVHSDLTKALDENLLSLEAAKDNHPLISAVYKAQAMNAFDKKMNEVIEASTFDDDVKAELASIKSSFKRFETLTAKLQEQKAAAPNKEDKTALQKQVDDLLNQLKEKDTSLTTEKANLEAARKGDRINYELKGLLSGVKTIYDELPSKVRYNTLKALIDDKLQEQEAGFDFDAKEAFSLLKKDGTNVVGANHTKYTPQSFIDELLAQHKILKVTESATPPATPGKIPGVRVVKAAEEAVSGNNQSVANLNRTQREAFAQSAAATN